MVQGTIRVALADAHTMFRQALAAMLDPDPCIEVVGHAATGNEALEVTCSARPHVLVLDTEISRPEAAETLKRLGARLDAPRVVVVTALGDPGFMRELIAASGRVPTWGRTPLFGT